MIFLLDQKQADIFKSKNTYYYQQETAKHNHDHNHNQSQGQQQQCCASFFSKVYIPAKERSGLETIVADVFRPASLNDHLPKLLDYLQLKFNRIKSSGQKDKLAFTSDVEVYLLNEVMREGVQLYFQQEIKQLMQKEQYIDSKQPMLLATPNTWTIKHPTIPLEFLDPDFIYQLMNRGYGVQIPFIKNLDFARAFYKECDYLEKDGRFEEPLQEQGIRDDKILWVTLTDIEKDSFKNIYFIAHILSALPYELNSKTQLIAQISETYQISYFNDKRQTHKRHLDSSYDKELDTGKKVSFFYIAVNPDEEKPNPDEIFKVWTDEDEHDIQIEQDMLIGLMSRKVPFAINTNGKKVFMIRFWVDGPKSTY